MNNSKGINAKDAVEGVSPDQMLRKALKWALTHGVQACDYGSGFMDSGCGCCSGSTEPPAEIDAIVREIRRELIEERKI